MGADKEINKESVQALRRLGSSPERWMRWLVRLSQVELEDLSEGDILNFISDITTMENFAPDLLFAGAGTRSDGTEKQVPWQLDWVALPDDPDAFIPTRVSRLGSLATRRAHLADIHGYIRKQIINLVDRRRIRLPLPPANIAITASPSLPTLRVSLLIQENVLGPWPYIVGFLLGGFGHTLRRCPECTTLFVQTRRDKGFCSRPCQARVATRKYRGIPNERKGKRGRPRGTVKSPLSKSAKRRKA